MGNMYNRRQISNNVARIKSVYLALSCCPIKRLVAVLCQMLMRMFVGPQVL